MQLSSIIPLCGLLAVWEIKHWRQSLASSSRNQMMLVNSGMNLPFAAEIFSSQDESCSLGELTMEWWQKKRAAPRAEGLLGSGVGLQSVQQNLSFAQVQARDELEPRRAGAVGHCRAPERGGLLE